MNRAALLPAFATLLAVQAVAQTPDTTRNAHTAAPVAQTAPLQGGIILDGRLDEAAWAAATPVTGFTQMDPEEGKPATEKTEVHFLYDGEMLYIGARMHDSGKVSRRLGRCDAWLADSDWFTVTLDSYHDHQTAFAFQVNPAGVPAKPDRRSTALQREP